MEKDMEITTPESIEQLILRIRGQKVILDRDLAELYVVSTSVLNKAVTRNIDRFPPDFMFRFTGEEFSDLKFHFGTSSWGGTRKLKKGDVHKKLKNSLQSYIIVSETTAAHSQRVIK